MNHIETTKINNNVEVKKFNTKADEEKGEVWFPLDLDLTKKAGTFLYEFIVGYPDGREERFPNNDYLKLKIMEAIGE